MPDKKVKFAETHMGPTGEASEPANHRPTAHSLGEFQDVLASAHEEFRKMEVRSEEELARDLPSEIDENVLKDAIREASRLSAQRTGMALMEMLMAEFKSAVEGEVASKSTTNATRAAGGNVPARFAPFALSQSNVVLANFDNHTESFYSWMDSMAFSYKRLERLERIQQERLRH